MGRARLRHRLQRAHQAVAVKSDIGAIAEVLSQAGALAEQRSAQKNAPDVKEAAILAEDQAALDKINQAIKNKDTAAMRDILSEK